MKATLSRRGFVRIASVSGIGVALSACAPKIVERTVEVEKVVTQIVQEVVKETVIVEGESKEVTKVVEKVVTATPMPPTPRPEAVKLRFRCDANPEMVAEFTQAAVEYRDIDPTVEIEVTDEAAPEGGMIPWMAAGTAPEMFRIAINEGPKFGVEGLGHEIEPLAEQLDIVDKFEPAIWNGFRYRGKIWSLPNDANTLLLWSNQRLFENAGMLDLYPPTNWEQMIKICEAVVKPDPDPSKAIFGYAIPTTIGWSGFFFWFWLWRFGGDFIDYETNEILFNSPEAVEAIEALRNLIQKQYLPAFDNWEDPWYTGRCAMIEKGSWMVFADVPGPWNDYKAPGRWDATYPRPEFSLTQQIELKPGVPRYSVYAGFSWFLPKQINKYPLESIKWLWYILSHETYGTAYLRIGKQIPCTKVVKHPWLDHPALKAYVDQLSTTKPLIFSPAMLQINDQCLNPRTMEAWLGKADIQKALEDAYKCAQPIAAEEG